MWQSCLECTRQYDTRDEVVALHLEVIKGMQGGTPPQEDIQAAAELAADSFCPDCLHDWAFAPNLFTKMEWDDGSSSTM